MRIARAAWWCAAVFLLVIATALMVEAQVLASSFDQLQVLVKPGDTVRVTDGTGVEARGTIGALSASSLEMIIEGNRRIFSENDVRTIRQRRGDSLKNGAWWGFGIMAGLALLGAAAEAPDGNAGEAVLGVLASGGFGAAIGVGVDAMIRSNEVVFSRPADVSTSLTGSPLLAASRKSLLLSVGF
jgi:hypothetical protein